VIEDVFRVGLSYRNLSIETTIFYQKLEADLNRYTLEILQYRIKDSKSKGNEPDVSEEQELIKETKELYIETC
jgi:hypothetical protein